MTFNKTLLTAAVLTVGGLSAISSANASGTDSSDFKITTTVTSVCSVSATGAGIAFEGVAAGTADATIAKKRSAGDIEVTCSKGAPYVINLTTAGNSTSTTGEGLMKGTLGDTITYELFSDADGSDAWGNTAVLGTVGNGISGTGTGVSTAIPHPVYATITGSTDVKQDTYTDTITASIIY